ncbi:MAG: DUF3187 family protein [Bdellovibrionales bacterium]|nr:DUF3187 family protein [Bdellovibrionales bacterium]
MSQVRVVSLLILVLVLSGVSPQELLSQSGPFELRQQYAPDALRLTGTAFRPQVREVGSSDLSLGVAWTSTFAEKNSYRIDEERVESRLRWRYGLSENIEGQIEIPVLWRGGGALDSFVDGWHDFFSLPEGGRDKAPQDDYFVSGVTTGGSSFELGESGMGLGNSIVSAKFQVLPEGEWSPALGLRPSFSLPTASDQYGHDGVDAGIEASLSKQVFSLIVYGGGGIFFHPDREISGLRYEPAHGEGFLAAEYPILDSLDLVVSGIWSSEIVSNIQEHPHHLFSLDYGLVLRRESGGSLTFGMRENPSAQRGSADFSFFFEGSVPIG